MIEVPVFILGGPTAAGKTDLAVELAERFGAGVVSADAMTVYRGLDIGTAKPDRQTLARVPHACIDVRDLHEDFSIADFLAAVEAERRRHQRLVIVGGTPFYLAGLLRPLASLPPSDPAIRAGLEALEDPHRRLKEIDPEAAARLHPNDRVRVVRALEVHALTGRTLTELHQQGPARPAIEATIAWLDRGDLRERIDLRLQQMRGQGYVEETREALRLPDAASLKPMRAFAYRHLVTHVQGTLDLDEALRRTARDSWYFARKQRTWARGMGWSPTDPGGVIALADACFGR